MRLEHFYCYNSDMRRFPELDIKEFKVFAKLDSPHKVQDFLDKLPINFEDVCRSPLMTLRQGTAHCMEGAMLAAAAFWYNGESPLLLDLRTAPGDEDHVVTLFSRPRRSGRGRYWGAVSKTNHSVLRYRDPVYRDIRELAMSFFNEYFLEDGRKTLRGHSAPFDLRRYGEGWLTTEEDMAFMEKDLDRSPHFRLISNATVRTLRPADPLEIKATDLEEWRPRKRRAG